MELFEFLQPISEADLRGAYWIEHPQVAERLSVLDNEATQVRLELIENTSDGNKLTYFVKFYATDNDPALDHDLERWLCDNKQCLGTPKERSRVAIRVRFYLRPKFQNAGLATYLHSREERVFREWGAREIQVLAMDTGRWVWTRPQFGYRIDPFEFHSLREKYKEWQRASGAQSIDLAADLSAFPQDFLLADEVLFLNLFKTL